MQKPVNIPAQFEKLTPFIAAHRTRAEMLTIVSDQLDKEKSLGSRNRWQYDINRHQALIELRDALKREMAHAD